MSIIPSYVAKVARAKQHLGDLETEIQGYVSSKPYTVRQRIEGKNNVRRLAFTSHPSNTDIPIIAADAIYNLRSSLDHLMSCLVRSNKRGSCMFPVYFQGVWDTGIEGENKQRTKERQRWASDTEGIKPEALAFLKQSQPPDDGGHDKGSNVHVVRAINKLSNRDRHEKLPVVATGLGDIHLSWTMPDGSSAIEAAPGTPGVFLNDKAKLPVPEDAVNVKIEGTPRIAIRIRDDGLHIELPSTLQLAVVLVEGTIIPHLSKYTRR